MLVLAAQLGTNLLVPRFGPEGPGAARHGARRDRRCSGSPASTLDSAYAADVLPPLMVIGLRDGHDHARVDADRHARRRPAVRRRRVGDGQHEPAGRRLDRHRAAQHPGRDGRRRLPRGPRCRPRRRSARRRPCTATRRRTGGAPGSSPSAPCCPRCCSAVAARPGSSPPPRARPRETARAAEAPAAL